jgi:predicted class III extradiol MEMO1 family dioxygenase
MVGSLSTEKENLYGQIFAPYLADPKNLFIISSDFCHWGQRFRYTFYEKSWGPIHQSIKTLDHKVQHNILCMMVIFVYFSEALN